MPPCADSLMSSSTGSPSAPMPIGTRSRLRGARGRHSAARSTPARVADAEQRRSASVFAASASSSGAARRLAAAGPAAGPAPRPRRATSCPGRRAGSARRLPVRSRLQHGQLLRRSPASRSVASASALVLPGQVDHGDTPSTPSAAELESSQTPGRRPRSPRGRAASAARPGGNRGRSVSSAPSIALELGQAARAISRTGPAASCSVGCSACGSHLTQSHQRMPVRRARTRRSAVVRGVEDRELGDHRPDQADDGARVAGRGRPGRTTRSETPTGRSGTVE